MANKKNYDWQTEMYGSKVYVSNKTKAAAQKKKNKNEARKQATYDATYDKQVKDFASKHGLEYNERLKNAINVAMTNRKRETDYAASTKKMQDDWKEKTNRDVKNPTMPYHKLDSDYKKDYNKKRQEMGFAKQEGPVSKAQYEALSADYSSRQKDGSLQFLKDVKDGYTGSNKRPTKLDETVAKVTGKIKKGYKHFEKSADVISKDKFGKKILKGADLLTEYSGIKDKIKLAKEGTKLAFKGLDKAEQYTYSPLKNMANTNLKDLKEAERYVKEGHTLKTGNLKDSVTLAKKDFKDAWTGERRESMPNIPEQYGLSFGKYGDKTATFATELVADPLNLVGAGVLNKAVKSSKKALDVAKSVQNTKLLTNSERLLLDAPKDYTPIEKQEKLKRLVSSTVKGKFKTTDAELVKPKSREQQKIEYAQKNAAEIDAVKQVRESEMRKQLEQEIEFEGHQKMADEYNRIKKLIGGRFNIPEANHAEFKAKLPKGSYSAKGKGKGDDIYKVADDLGMSVDELTDYYSRAYDSHKIVNAGKGKFVTQKTSGNPDTVLDELFEQHMLTKDLPKRMESLPKMPKKVVEEQALGMKLPTRMSDKQDMSTILREGIQKGLSHEEIQKLYPKYGDDLEAKIAKEKVVYDELGYPKGHSQNPFTKKTEVKTLPDGRTNGHSLTSYKKDERVYLSSHDVEGTVVKVNDNNIIIQPDGLHGPFRYDTNVVRSPMGTRDSYLENDVEQKIFKIPDKSTEKKAVMDDGDYLHFPEGVKGNYKDRVDFEMPGYTRGHKFEDFKNGDTVSIPYWDGADSSIPYMVEGKVHKVVKAKNAQGKDVIRNIEVEISNKNKKPSKYDHPDGSYIHTFHGHEQIARGIYQKQDSSHALDEIKRAQDELSAGLDDRPMGDRIKNGYFPTSLKRDQLKHTKNGKIASPNVEASKTSVKEAYTPKNIGPQAKYNPETERIDIESDKLSVDRGGVFRKMKDLPWQGRNFLSLYETIEHLPQQERTFLLRSLNHGKEANTNTQIAETEKFRTKVTKGQKVSNGTKKSAITQQFGELKFAFDYLERKNLDPKKFTKEQLKLFNKAELKRVRPNDFQEIMNANNYIHNNYIKFMNQYNAKRVEMGKPEIPLREDFYKHMQDLEGLNNVKNQNFGGAGTDVRNDPHLEGRHSWVTPTSKRDALKNSLIHGKMNYKEDAVANYLRFVKAASQSIHLEPVIDDINIVKNALVKATKGKSNVKRMISALDAHAREIGGRTHEGDISAHSALDSKRIVSTVHGLNSRVQANMIKGNVGSLVGQLGGVPVNIAKAGPMNSAKGFVRTLKDLGKADAPVHQSRFFKERYLHEHFDKFNVKLIHQPGKLADWALNFMDKFVGRFTWNAMYEKGLAKKVGDPIKYADYQTRHVMAGRGVGEVPLFHKSLIGKSLSPFTLEIGNQWKVLGGIWKNPKERANVLTYILGAYAINRVAENMRGSGITWDPLDAVIDGYTETEGNVIRKVAGSLGYLTGETIGSVPGGQLITGTLNDRYVPFTNDKYKYEDIFGQRNPNRFGSDPTITKGFEDLEYYALPFGAAQWDKTKKGYKAIKEQGVRNKSGELKYPIDTKGIMKKAQLLTFGPGSAPESREYYKHKKPPGALSGPQENRINNAVDRYEEYKKILAERKRNAETKKRNKLK